MATTTGSPGPATTPPPRDPGGRDHRWAALGVIALAQLMVALDATIVNVALPTAQRALGFDDAHRSYVVTAYTLSFAGLLLLGGKTSDRIGRRRALTIGLTGFGLASALAGAAPTFEVLVAGRALQGASAAFMAPAALALIAATFTEPRERGKAFGVFGAVASSGAVVGLLLGGVLTEYAGWRWCLYVNVARGRRRDRDRPPGAAEGRRLPGPGRRRLRACSPPAGWPGWCSARARLPRTAGARSRCWSPGWSVLGLIAGLPAPPARAGRSAAAAVDPARPRPRHGVRRHRDQRGRHVRDVPDADLPLPGGAGLQPGPHRARVPADVPGRRRQLLRDRQPADGHRRPAGAGRSRPARRGRRAGAADPAHAVQRLRHR